MPFPTFASPGRDAPFARDAKSIADVYFPGAEARKVGRFTVLSVSEGSHVIVDELALFDDRNGNGVRDTGERIEESYHLFIFVSKDARELQAAFDDFRPAPADVCIFLEDNSSDTVSGTTAWIRQSKSTVVVGPTLRNELAEWMSGKAGGAFEELRQLGGDLGFDLDVSAADLATLVREGELRDANLSFLIAFMQLVHAFDMAAAPLYAKIAEALTELAAFARKQLAFEPRHWDPAAQALAAKPGEPEANAGFEPVLLPFSHRFVDGLAELEDAGVRLVTERLRRELTLRHGSVEKLLFRASSTSPGGAALPAAAQRCSKRLLGVQSELLLRAIATSERVVPLYASYSKTWLNAVNAFYCGLWNSVVEVVVGLVDFLALGFGAFAFAGRSLKEAKELVPATLEVLDELMQTVVEVDWTALFDDIVNALVARLSRLNLAAFVADLSVERIAYFTGGAVGFVAETLLDIASGGAKSVQKSLAKFGEVAKAVHDLVDTSVRAATQLSKSPWENVLALLRRVIEVLRGSRAEVVRLLDAVFDQLVRSAVLADDAVEAILRRLGIGPAEKKLLDDLGMAFVSDSNGVARCCNVFDTSSRTP